MGEQAGGRPCQWAGCGEAASKRADRMRHVAVREDESGKPVIHDQVTSRYLCDRHCEEFRAQGGVKEMPFGLVRTE